MNLQEFRSQYPQYNDVPDKELVKSLHQKFYSDVPLTQFAQTVGFKGAFDQNDLAVNKEDETYKAAINEATSGRAGFMAGTGKAFSDVGLGVRQLVGQDVQAEIDERKKTDQPLMSSAAGLSGNILGNAALFAPTAFIPGANTYTGAALIGAGLGATAPVATGESRTVNAVQGGAAGLIGQGIGRAIGRVISPIQSRLSGPQQSLAQAAEREGIPLQLSQQTGSRPMAIAESVMESMPLTSERAIGEKVAQQTAFTRAALKRAGIDAAEATPDILSSQKQTLGREFERIAGGSHIDFNNPGFLSKLTGVVQNASRRLTPDKAKAVANTVDDILSQVDDAGRMTGSNYQGWRTELRALGKGTDYESSVYTNIRRILDDAFTDQLQGQQAIDWKNASRQYANLKTIIDAMGQAGAASKTGVISPAALEGALTKSIGREGKALGRGDLNELVGIGRTFVSNNIPESGTGPRQLMMKLLTGQAAGVVPGAAAGYYGGGAEGAAYGAAAGLAGGLAGPRLIQMAMQNPVIRSYLAKSGGRVTPEILNMITNMTRLMALGTSTAALPQ